MVTTLFLSGNHVGPQFMLLVELSGEEYQHNIFFLFEKMKAKHKKLKGNNYPFDKSSNVTVVKLTRWYKNYLRKWCILLNSFKKMSLTSSNHFLCLASGSGAVARYCKTFLGLNNFAVVRVIINNLLPL